MSTTGRLMHAEWTKFRTVRGWVLGMLTAVVVTLLIGLLSLAGGQSGCHGNDCAPPLGPGGEAVADSFTFVHQPMGDQGSVTTRVNSLKGDENGLQEWAKAGLIIKASTAQGAPYAAIMTTGDHGVRMQDNFTDDIAGSHPSPSTPQWLRLSRSGDEVTGWESADGSAWTKVGTVHVDLPATALSGLFVTSPDAIDTSQSFGSASAVGGPTKATATFDQVRLAGATGPWTEDEIGRSTGGGAPVPSTGYHQSAGTFTLSGSGDIAPNVAGPDPNTIERNLSGAFAGLIAVIVVATMFITSEYRRGLIRTTLAASPVRVRALGAKAAVIGGIAFLTGLVASAGAFWLVGGLRRHKGQLSLPVSGLTELRVFVGTAALIALVAVLALSVGTILRRSAAAVTAAIALVVLPYILSIAPVLPVGAAQWALRVTPAAGFAIQQSTRSYAQVRATYTPITGFFPLQPWAGFAVLCLWTALAFGLAAVVLRRRDV